MRWILFPFEADLPSLAKLLQALSQRTRTDAQALRQVGLLPRSLFVEGQKDADECLGCAARAHRTNRLRTVGPIAGPEQDFGTDLICVYDDTR